MCVLWYYQKYDGGNVMKPSLYLETTIPSYLAARTSANIIIAGRQAVTHEFFESEKHKYNLYVSDYVYEECEKATSLPPKDV